MTTNRLPSSGSLTALGLASGVDGEFPHVRTACMDDFVTPIYFTRLFDFFLDLLHFFFLRLLELARRCLTSLRGTTLRTWKAAIHLIGLKPSGILCGAYGGTPHGCQAATHQDQLLLSWAAFS